ncbi:hypothetical protein [Amphritea balenae]|uniref:Uracil-DNA glycosylase-like domain-containing protein n=1 Tax=Amphritea balenae TaxID=452629 RepID=A0A3P1SNK7_9GAMM|nr:hypothetical protein [Amphritea balenae]RRC98589.1 hypothetical protein EHS89_13335 [Amphritea balenae]GGK65764.1 hypothetical protein GCM10007941_14940 [Amphritea balenae]
MDQQRRHQYLDAMGIASWLPRRQLTVARPTPDWVWEFCWPEQTDQQASASQTSPGQTSQRQGMVSPEASALAAKQARAELSASFGAQPGTAKVQPETAPSGPAETPPTVQSEAKQDQAGASIAQPEPAVVAPSVASQPVSQASADIAEVSLPDPSSATVQAPFKLAFMSYGDCLVVDSLPPQARQSATQADSHHQILLDKILRSIRLTGGACGDYYTLPWPMFASKSLNQGAEQARLTVQHKLRKALQKQPVGTVILLGEAAAQMILERSEPLDQLRGMLFSLRSDVKTLATASLSEMMTLPDCKRDVWRDLQPLLDHLEQQSSQNE